MKTGEKTQYKKSTVDFHSNSPVGKSVGDADGLNVAVGDAVGKLKTDMRDNTSFSLSVMSSAESQLWEPVFNTQSMDMSAAVSNLPL